MSSRARALVVDDHPLFRRGLVGLLQDSGIVDVVAEADNARDAKVQVSQYELEVIICDLSLPDISGLSLIADIRAGGYQGALLVLSMRDELMFAPRALRAGADGYLDKSSSPDEIVDAVRRVLLGERVLSQEQSERLNARKDGAGVPDSPGTRLSNRELEVFELTGRGHGTREVAEGLGISIKTVETHKANIRAKLVLADASELMRAAVAWVAEARDERSG
ncbi:MAG: response regulator [Myxococcota bacterium]